jgi:hypothetical protein
MIWVVGLVLFLCGWACGYLSRRRHDPEVAPQPAAVDAIVPADDLARAGTAVLMHGTDEVSRRTLKAPTSEMLRYHGRNKKDRYVYVGQNARNEYVFQLVTD